MNKRANSPSGSVVAYAHLHRDERVSFFAGGLFSYIAALPGKRLTLDESGIRQLLDPASAEEDLPAVRWALYELTVLEYLTHSTPATGGRYVDSYTLGPAALTTPDRIRVDA